MADGALTHAQQRRQIAHAHLLNIQGADDAGPRGIPEHLEQLGDFVNRLLVRHFGFDPRQNILVDHAALLQSFLIHDIPPIFHNKQTIEHMSNCSYVHYTHVRKFVNRVLKIFIWEEENEQ